MKTYTVSLTSDSSSSSYTESTHELFDLTELSLDLSEVYSNIFPNYVAIRWGDDSGLEEPEITIYRNYKTQSIFPEIRNGASPVFFNEPYKHIFYPSATALKKSMTMRVNVGYIDGNTAKFSIPINVRTEGYHQNIGDIDLLNVSLLNNKDNKSIFTFLAKKDNFVIQNHNNHEIQYDSVSTSNLSSYSDTSNESINLTQSLLSAVADPIGAEAKFSILSSATLSGATWRTDFWGYSNRSIFNFSGTSFKGSGFADNNNITLISPRHGISIDRFTNDPKADDIAYFYDQTTGSSISGTISAATSIGNDLRVYSFNRDMSTATTAAGATGSLKLYKLPRFENEVPSLKYPIVTTGGNKMFGSDRFTGFGAAQIINKTTQLRNFQQEIITNVSTTSIIDLIPTGIPGQPGLIDYILTGVSPTLSSYNLSLSGLANGDSGSPNFIPYNSELFLLGLWTSKNRYGGSLTNLGNVDVQSSISTGMETVGNTWGYKLSTVRLS
tara:strand:+ start:5822 stop:7312 length:1491 start_codon:yes stop_codon:yes gene_type:complete